MKPNSIPLTKHQIDTLGAGAIRRAVMTASDESFSRFQIHVTLASGAVGVVWTSRNGPRLFLADTAIRFARETLGVPAITVQLATQ